MPGHLHRAVDALGVRHHDGEAAVGGGEPGDAVGRAVRVEGIGLRDAAVVVDVAQRDDGLLLPAVRAEIGAALSMRDDDGQAAAGHAVEEQRGTPRHLDHDEARLELLAAVAHEARPVLGAGNDLGEVAHHLAAVADAQREGVRCARRRPRTRRAARR
jgi:hypothetical protein